MAQFITQRAVREWAGPGSLGQSVSTTGCTRTFAHLGGHLSLSSGPDHQIGPFLSHCLRPQENDTAEGPLQSLQPQCAYPLEWADALSCWRVTRALLAPSSSPDFPDLDSEQPNQLKRKYIYIRPPHPDSVHLSWGSANKNSMMSSPY